MQIICEERGSRAERGRREKAFANRPSRLADKNHSHSMLTRFSAFLNSGSPVTIGAFSLNEV